MSSISTPLDKALQAWNKLHIRTSSYVEALAGLISRSTYLSLFEKEQESGSREALLRQNFQTAESTFRALRTALQDMRAILDSLHTLKTKSLSSLPLATLESEAPILRLLDALSAMEAEWVVKSALLERIEYGKPNDAETAAAVWRSAMTVTIPDKPPST